MRIQKAYLSILFLLAMSLCGCGAKENVREASVPVRTAPAVSADVSVKAGGDTPAPTAVPPKTPAPVKAHALSVVYTPMEVSLSVYTPTPTPSPVPTPSPTPVPFLGEWSYDFEGESITLILSPDGSGIITYAGNEQSFTWEYQSGTIVLNGVNTVFSASFAAEKILVATAEGTLEFTGKEFS